MGVIVTILGISSALADTGLTGKLVYEERQEDKQASPAIVLRDMSTLERRVIAAPGMNPRWFPSGREVAYFLPDDEPDGIAELAGNTSRRLTLGEYGAYRAVFPGKTIVVDTEGHRLRELNHFIADIDSTGRRAVTIRPVVRSITGQTSYWWTRRSGDLMIQNTSSGELSMVLSATEIANDSGKDLLRDAQWSRDGRYVIYQTEAAKDDSNGDVRGSTWAIYRIDIETKKHSRLLPLKDSTMEPDGHGFSISPDGNRIVFTRRSDKGLWALDLSTSKVENIQIDERSYRKRNPRFSPDGRSILFELLDLSDVGSTISFWVAPSEGGYASRLFPRTWRHFVRFFVLAESDRLADWWQPSVHSFQTP
ncbi:MAG TPA: hypothetical protein VFK92_13420 [Burkholderiales bacterium]|nr:hypothetical protein [Burkholderiales bacterium]